MRRKIVTLLGVLFLFGTMWGMPIEAAVSAGTPSGTPPYSAYLGVETPAETQTTIGDMGGEVYVFNEDGQYRTSVTFSVGVTRLDYLALKTTIDATAFATDRNAPLETCSVELTPVRVELRRSSDIAYRTLDFDPELTAMMLDENGALCCLLYDADVQSFAITGGIAQGDSLRVTFTVSGLETWGEGNYVADDITYYYRVRDDGTIEITHCTNCTATTLTIPSKIDGYTVTSIGEQAFADCDTLTDVLIPRTVVSIGSRAFADCVALLSVTIMNPDCSIADAADTFSNDGDIYTGIIASYADSTAATYAENWNRFFVSIGTALGDVDGDGSVTPIDARLILIAYATEQTGRVADLTDAQKLIADVDASGKIDAVDAHYVLVYYATEQVRQEVTWDMVLS